MAAIQQNQQSATPVLILTPISAPILRLVDPFQFAEFSKERARYEL